MGKASLLIDQGKDAGAPRRLPFSGETGSRLDALTPCMGRDDDPEHSNQGATWFPFCADASAKESRVNRLSEMSRHFTAARGGAPRLSSRNATPNPGGALGE